MFRLSQPQQSECHLSKQPLTPGFGSAAPTPVRQQTQQPDKDERRPLSPSQCQFSRQPSWPPVHEASSLSPFKTWPDCQASPVGFAPTPKGDESGSHFWDPSNKQTDQQFHDAARETDNQEQTARHDMKPSWPDENGEVEQPRRLSLSQRIEAAVRSPPYGDHRPARQPAKERSSSRKDTRLRSDGGNHEMKRRHFHPTDRDSASYGSVERMAQDRDERHDTPTYNDDSLVLADKYQRGKTDSVRYKQSSLGSWQLLLPDLLLAHSNLRSVTRRSTQMQREEVTPTTASDLTLVSLAPTSPVQTNLQMLLHQTMEIGAWLLPLAASSVPT